MVRSTGGAITVTAAIAVLFLVVFTNRYIGCANILFFFLASAFLLAVITF